MLIAVVGATVAVTVGDLAATAGLSVVSTLPQGLPALRMPFVTQAAVFEEHVLQAIATAPTPTKWVVVAAEPVTDIDITAADMLADLDQKLHQADMDICFAEMKGPVKDVLKRYGLFDSLGTENFFPTIGQAVDRYLEIHKVSWRDWDEPV